MCFVVNMKSIFLFKFFILLVLPIVHAIFDSWIPFSWWGNKCEINETAHENLGARLRTDLFGQHIVQPYLELAIKNHLTSELSEHALSIVFMGSTGTGKTFVARLLEESLYGLNSKFVKFYSGRLDFPSAQHVEEYRGRLQKDVEESVKKCPRSVFIFDEIDKVPPGIIDKIKPYLDYQPKINNVDYRRAVFLFLTNWGSKEINSIYLDLRNQGLARESMQSNHYEKSLRQSLHDKSEGMFHESDMIKDFVISHYLPFLPLEKVHVEKCIIREMRRRNIKPNEANVEKILQKMEFFEGLSISGCKRVSDLVSVQTYHREDL